MTGTELFEALSFVDEKYIAEADSAKLGRNVPWMKVLSVAACLCILIVGAFALENFGHKGAMESMREEAAAAPQAETHAAAEEAAPMETACAIPKEESAAEESLTEDVAGAAGGLQHIPYATLRILNVREDGSYEVFVERVADEPGPFDAGVELMLVIDPEKIPLADRTDTVYEGTVTVDMLVEIQNGAYDAGSNTLYAEGVFAAAIVCE